VIYAVFLKILKLSVLELSVLTSATGYHRQCICSHCACTVSRDLCVHRVQIFPTYLKSLMPIFLFTVQLVWLYD